MSKRQLLGAAVVGALLLAIATFVRPRRQQQQKRSQPDPQPQPQPDPQPQPQPDPQPQPQQQTGTLPPQDFIDSLPYFRNPPRFQPEEAELFIQQLTDLYDPLRVTVETNASGQQQIRYQPVENVRFRDTDGEAKQMTLLALLYAAFAHDEKVKVLRSYLEAHPLSRYLVTSYAGSDFILMGSEYEARSLESSGLQLMRQYNVTPPDGYINDYWLKHFLCSDVGLSPEDAERAVQEKQPKSNGKGWKLQGHFIIDVENDNSHQIRYVSSLEEIPASAEKDLFQVDSDRPLGGGPRLLIFAPPDTVKYVGWGHRKYAAWSWEAFHRLRRAISLQNRLNQNDTAVFAKFSYNKHLEKLEEDAVTLGSLTWNFFERLEIRKA